MRQRLDLICGSMFYGKADSAYNADKWTRDSVPAHYEIKSHRYMVVTGAKSDCSDFSKGI